MKVHYIAKIVAEKERKEENLRVAQQAIPVKYKQNEHVHVHVHVPAMK